jgi:hypothetical protein
MPLANNPLQQTLLEQALVKQTLVGQTLPEQESWRQLFETVFICFQIKTNFFDNH